MILLCMSIEPQDGTYLSDFTLLAIMYIGRKDRHIRASSYYNSNGTLSASKRAWRDGIKDEFLKKLCYTRDDLPMLSSERPCESSEYRKRKRERVEAGTWIDQRTKRSRTAGNVKDK